MNNIGTEKKKRQMNNIQEEPKSEERKKLPPDNVYYEEATLIYDFQSATQEEIDIVAVSILKKISIKQSHELRKTDPKKFNLWYRRFWFKTGKWMEKPPTPPNGWFVKCVLTQPAMKENEWRPANWWARILTCPLKAKCRKPICRVLPGLYEVTEKNKNVQI